MNTKTKIAMGIAASALAVTAFTGTAIAAPLMTAGTVRPAYQMMYGGTAVSGSDAGAGAGSLVASMQRFMNQYRTTDGRIDVTRMHADVAAGKATPPCITGTRGTSAPGAGSGARGGVGYRMMNGAGSGTGFGGMMGNRF